MNYLQNEKDDLDIFFKDGPPTLDTIKSYFYSIDFEMVKSLYNRLYYTYYSHLVNIERVIKREELPISNVPYLKEKLESDIDIKEVQKTQKNLHYPFGMKLVIMIKKMSKKGGPPIPRF